MRLLGAERYISNSLLSSSVLSLKYRFQGLIDIDFFNFLTTIYTQFLVFGSVI